MAILKAPLRLSRALYPMGSMLFAFHPGGMESAWLRAANPAAAIATAPPAAAHRRYFVERIRFLHGCGQWPILERIPMKWNRRHPSSIPVSREHRRAKTDRLDTELLKRAFLDWKASLENDAMPWSTCWSGGRHRR